VAEGDYIDFLVDYLGGENQKLPDFVDRDIFRTGLIDSFGVIALATLLEEKHDVDFSPDDFTYENFSSIKNIAKLCCKRSIEKSDQDNE